MWSRAVQFFTNSIETDGRNVGLNMEQCGRSECCALNGIPSKFGDILMSFKDINSRIVFVVMIDECYAVVKRWADSHG